MGRAAALREEAIALFQAAEALIDDNADGPKPGDTERFDELMAEGRRKMTAFRAQSVRESGGSPGPAPTFSNDANGLRTVLADIAGGPSSRLPGMGGLPLPGGSGGQASWGESFIQARTQARGLTTGSFNAALLEPGTVPVTVPLRPEAIDDPRRARFLYQLLAEEGAPGGQFAYWKQTARDLNAAVVEPGEKKPESTFTRARMDDKTKVIAHVTEPVSRFDIQDAPLLRTFIDQELRLGVNLALDDRVASAILAEATTGSGTLGLAGIRSAITTLQLIEMEPDAIGINPTDWEAVEAEALDTFAQIDSGAWTEAMARRLFSVPVVVSNSVSPGAAIVGDFRGSALLYVTGDVLIDVSDSTPRDVGGETVSDFRLNQLVFRGERRAEVAIGRPAGFVVVGTIAS